MIPLVDIRAEIESIRGELDEAVRSIVDSAAFILGPGVEGFEKAFAEYVGVKHCVGVNSGTAALHVALLAADVGPGDEVITVPSSFFATAEAISLTGARPVFVDVEPDTLNMDPDRLSSALSSKTKVILPVHLFGQAASLDAILACAQEREIPVIEDACQAHGATYGDRRVGSLGRAGCFSFYPGKNLGAFGEGGALTTSDDALAARARLLREHGSPEKYRHSIVGFNYRLEGLQGAVLSVKLRHLEEWNQARRRLAKRYRERLQGVGDVRPLSERTHGTPVYHLFVIRSAHRDRIFASFERRGIARAIHYPTPIHRLDVYRDAGYGDFPVAEAAAREVLSLPLYPRLTEAQQDEVIDAVRAAFA